MTVCVAECFDALALALRSLPNQLPTPQDVMTVWPRVSEHWSLSAQRFFLERGGSVDLAMAVVIDSCSHMEPDGMFDYVDEVRVAGQGGIPEALPRCSNDADYDGVFAALLAQRLPRRLPGCPDCGLRGSDDENDI